MNRAFSAFPRGTEFPGAMPQARVEIAPLALKHGRFRDCRAVTLVKAGFVTLPCRRGELPLDRRVGFKPLPSPPWLPSPFRGSLQPRGIYDVQLAEKVQVYETTPIPRVLDRNPHDLHL